ncbi:hypothetical protein [Streptomyces racemochromogenes]|uniref:hypothetical protein n=1 Tax=Streptomyces racemochromogenes TaxID=67353 RepID=UPI0035ED0D86
MVRGTPGAKREHTVSVRLSEEERKRWAAARAESGRREMGAWVRAVVEERLAGEAGGAPGAAGPPPGPELDPVSEAAYAELCRIGANVNQLVRYSHQDGAIHPAIEAALYELGAAAAALRGIPLDRE